MTIYIVIFAIFSFIAIFKLWKSGKLGVIAIPLVVFLTLFIGYRYYIGVDWKTYNTIFFDISRMSMIDALGYTDSAYSFINWIVARLGGQVWHVNLICAALFSVALMTFCKNLPRPGIALVVATPMLIIVTAMGYTRQATAIACIMIAFNQFRGKINWNCIVWLCLAILFHRSAIFIVLIFIISGSYQQWLNFVIGGMVISILLLSSLLNNLRDVLSLYFEGDMESSGTLPRITIGAVVSIVFFMSNKGKIFEERRALIRNIAIMMIALIPIYFIISSKTVVDRIGILFIPFQSVIVSYVIESFDKNPVAELIATTITIYAYFSILIAWMIFATFSYYWIPYNNVFFIR